MCFCILDFKSMQFLNMIPRFTLKKRCCRQSHSLKQRVLKMWERLFDSVKALGLLLEKTQEYVRNHLKARVRACVLHMKNLYYQLPKGSKGVCKMCKLHDGVAKI